jgi:putative ABC transport system substrate-binding protein
MKRREFIALVGGASVCPLTVYSQQVRGRRRIGYLATTLRSEPMEEAFEKALQALGWFRDQNIQIEYRYEVGRQSTIVETISEISHLGWDVVVTWSTSIVLPLTQAVPQISVVFLAIDIDPVAAGLVSNVAHPGGHITGITNGTNQLPDKRLQVLKETLPGLARVAVLLPTQIRSYSAPALQRFKGS